MKKLALGALFGFLAACGGGKSSTDGPIIQTGDGGVDAPIAACNVLANTGCAATEKCTWIDDTATLGHIGCAALAAAPVALGAACTVGAPGPNGFDNCVGGAYCEGKVCKSVCDPQGGAPNCGTTGACSRYDGLFGPSGMETAGVCDPTCSPLTQTIDSLSGSAAFNCGAALGSGGAATSGCYGVWRKPSKGGSQFSCVGVPSSAAGKSHGVGIPVPYINGCLPGNEPLGPGPTAMGSSSRTCFALCQPADTYMGSITNRGGTTWVAPTASGAPGFGIAALPTGVPGTRCKDRGATGPSVDCIYGSALEFDSAAMTNVASKYGDTIGFCEDAAIEPMIPDVNNTTMIAWPTCDKLPLKDPGASQTPPVSTTYTAGDFGCVSSITAMWLQQAAPRKRPAMHQFQFESYPRVN